MAHRDAFVQFLARARDAVVAAAATPGPHPHLIAVLGNEGGDMDSTMGALYLAYALQRHGSVAQFAARRPSDAKDTAPPSTSGVQFVPFINYAPEDLVLRGDVALAMRRASIDRALLCSAVANEDVEGSPSRRECGPAGSELLEACASIVLVDHNKLRASQLHLASRVIGTIDHHADEGAIALDAALRVVERAGSACSLLLRSWPRDGAAYDPPVPLPELLLGTIVLDTANFDPIIDKTTKIDTDAAVELARLRGEAVATPSDLVSLCAPLLKDLGDARFDLTGLSVSQNLRRDYKEFSLPIGAGCFAAKVGIAAWLESCEAVVTREGASSFVDALTEFATRRGLHAVGVMFAFKAPELQRQCLFCVLNAGDGAPSVRAALASFTMAASDTDGSAQLTPLDAGLPHTAAAEMMLFRQGNLAVSRKVLVPHISEHFAHL